VAIDARITGLSETAGVREVHASLVDRDKNSAAGQTKLRILNPPNNWAKSSLPDLIGCEVWGNANELYLGDTRFAFRISYTSVYLVNDWENILRKHCEIRKANMQNETTEK
jgi:hypothetical protein